MEVNIKNNINVLRKVEKVTGRWSSRSSPIAHGRVEDLYSGDESVLDKFFGPVDAVKRALDWRKNR